MNLTNFPAKDLKKLEATFAEMKKMAQEDPVYKECECCGTHFSKPPKSGWDYFYTRRFCSVRCSRLVLSKDRNIAEKIKKANKGKKPWNTGKRLSKKQREKQLGKGAGIAKTLDHRLKISRAHKKLVEMGIHHLWKGGISPERQMVMGSMEYRQWRKQVFERDGYTCQMCGIRGGNLHADHIIPYSKNKDLRLSLSNGRTLCLSCHYFVTFGRKPVDNTVLTRWGVRNEH